MTEIKLNHPSLYICYGRPASGKSILIKYIIGHFMKENLTDLVYVQSGSHFNNFFQSFLSEKQVSPYNETKITKLMNLCAKKKQDGINFRVLFILDDCIGSAQWKSKVFLKLINQFRHYNITLVIATQYCCAITPNIRSNCTLAFIFPSRQKNDIEALYQSYGAGSFNSLQEFTKFLTSLDRYNCLVVDNSNYTNPIALFQSPLL